MFDLNDIVLTEHTNSDGEYCVEIRSPNGLHYTIIDNKPSHGYTYLKLSHFDEDIFEISMIKKQGEAVFDAKFFKGTHHHCLFRMDSETLSNFLNETNKDIKLIFCEYNTNALSELLIFTGIKNVELSNHYLYIGKTKFQLNEQINDNGTKTYTYHQDLINNLIGRLVYKHSVMRYSEQGFPIKATFNHYKTVGNHCSVIGVFKAYYIPLFCLKYFEKTLELEVKRFNGETYVLHNQTLIELRDVFKKELLAWLAVDGTPDMQAALKEHDFTDVECDDCLKLLEMAII